MKQATQDEMIRRSLKQTAKSLSLVVNGMSRTVTATADTPLLYVLRDELHLRGPRFGCGLAQFYGMTETCCYISQQALDGRPFAYFDGPGGSQVPQEVADGVFDRMVREAGTKLASKGHRPSKAADGGTTAHDKDGKVIKSWKETKEAGEAPHFKNFIEAVRSRKREDLYAEILEGHLSSALCHTGNISYRLGQKEAPGAILEKIKGDREATATVERMFEHLKANEVDINMDKLALGPVLKMDGKTEKFIGNADADKMLTRDYRKPFVVPAITA